MTDEANNVFSEDAKREALRTYHHRGAAIYLSAYIGLMMDGMGVKATTKSEINALALEMVEPLNIATEAIWRAMMSDQEWATTGQRFEDALTKLAKGAEPTSPMFPQPEMDFDI